MGLRHARNYQRGSFSVENWDMVKIPDINDQAVHPEVVHPFADMNNRVADRISAVFGSMSMFWLLVSWQLLWIALATLSIWVFRQDKYPFPFLLFLSNLIQLWALPVLAVTQNRADEKRNAKAQADHDALTYLATKIDDVYAALNERAAVDNPAPHTPSQ